jgi:P-aminobenzoate N-oxygenase AurF
MLTLERINRHAEQNGIALSRIALDTPIDSSRLFISPTLTPLWHDPIYRELSAEQQLRYNQLCGLMQNEMAIFLEREFAGHVLPAMLADQSAKPAEMVLSLRQFLEEERQHSRMFHRLNRAADPAMYGESEYCILRPPRFFVAGLRFVLRRPMIFPMVFWMMLMMEERTLMIHRRYAEMEPEKIEPTFASAYRAHAEDEVRHVQLDWHLLEAFYENRPRWVRAVNAKLLEWTVFAFFLKPRRANVRVVDRLIEEFPELEPMRPRLVGAIRGMTDHPGYRQMMYSDEANPLARALLERLPEFARLSRRLYGASPS